MAGNGDDTGPLKDDALAFLKSWRGNSRIPAWQKACNVATIAVELCKMERERNPGPGKPIEPEQFLKRALDLIIKSAMIIVESQ